VLIEQPWSRVKNPVAIPPALDPAGLAALPDEEFARLVRDHLVPRQPAGEERRLWERLWGLLGRDERLADRTFDVLEDFLDGVEAVLDSGQLDEHQQARAEKFRRFCDDAWKRLQVDDDKPLGWAGRAAAGFNPPARRVIEQLVDAIAEHRRTVATAATTPKDKRLWQVLADVGLDPEGSRRRR
jgi:hypothetical protein